MQASPEGQCRCPYAEVDPGHLPCAEFMSCDDDCARNVCWNCDHLKRCHAPDPHHAKEKQE